MIHKCQDEKCKYYGKDLVDRGYGYPVCQSNTGNLNPIPMNPDYDKEYNHNL